MKKIINGKLYDTDTARLIGTWDNGESSLNCVEEGLYRKKTGEFFLHGIGGANTKYAESLGSNSWCGSEKIIPLPYDEAQQWAEEHLTSDEYEAIFGEVEESEDRMTVTLSLSVATVEKAKRAAAQRGISLSAYVESMILAGLDAQQTP